MIKKLNLTVREAFNYALENHKKNNYPVAINAYMAILKINPTHVGALNNLGAVFNDTNEYKKAIDCYERAIKVDLNYTEAHCNLGTAHGKLGEYQKAIDCYERAIKVDPSYEAAYNNLGAAFQELGKNQKAKTCYKKAIEIAPNYTQAYWNLHSTSSNIDDALIVLKRLHEIDNKHIKSKIMISALHGFKGNFNDFNNLLASRDADHPHSRSIKWVFSLPKLPKLFFNYCDFFDAVIELTDDSRPFYEFGVWKGVSFKYLINKFKKGFGFDTFTGIPNSWHNVPKDHYSSFGEVPEVEGGEFIVGKFEDTLPKFFSEEKPIASLINFDADLYSSTLCALNYSNKIIDKKTILVFDEFIMNKNWEKDEYKALNDFCDSLKISYEVLAVSFCTGQVAVKLIK